MIDVHEQSATAGPTSLRDDRTRPPRSRIRLATSVERLGQNNKISNLYRLVKEAQYDLLVMSDSDVRVEPDYLRELVATFANPGVGAVTSFYRCAGGGTLVDPSNRLRLLD